MNLRTYPAGPLEVIRFRVCRWLAPKLLYWGWALAFYGATNEELLEWGAAAKAAGYEWEERR